MRLGDAALADLGILPPEGTGGSKDRPESSGFDPTANEMGALHLRSRLRLLERLMTVGVLVVVVLVAWPWIHDIREASRDSSVHGTFRQASTAIQTVRLLDTDTYRGITPGDLTTAGFRTSDKVHLRVLTFDDRYWFLGRAADGSRLWLFDSRTGRSTLLHPARP